MTNQWFGDKEKPWGERCSHMPYVDTPIGQKCLHCEEVIVQGEEGEIMLDGRPIHRECLVRSVMGSVGHQKKTCSCYGGSEGDPPGLTKREAAIAAAAFFQGGIN